MLPIIIFLSSYFMFSSLWSEMSIFYLLPAPILAYFLICFILSHFFDIQMASINDVAQTFCEAENSKCRVVVGIIYEEKIDLDSFLSKLKQRSLIHLYYNKLRKNLHISKKFLLFGYWKPSKNFNIDDHYEVLPQEFSTDDLYKMIGDELCTVEFAPDKPQWKNFLIPNLEGNRSALVMKIHHSYIDGISGFTYFLNLTDCKNYSFINLPKISKLQWVYIFLVGFLQTFPAYIKYIKFVWDRRPFHSGNVTGKKRVYSKELCSLEALKIFTRENKVTINDTLTTLLAITLKKYYQDQNIDLDGNLLTMMPISLRDLPKPEQHYPLDNQSLVLYVKLPLFEKFKPEFFKEIVLKYHKILGKLKGSYEAYFMKFALEVMPIFFPPYVMRWLVRHICEKVSLLITNVPGPTSKLISYGKYRVSQILSTVNLFSDLELAFTILSYDGKISVTCICDEINKIDPKVLLELANGILEKEVLKVK